MKLINNPDRSQWAEILKRPVMNTENLFDTVRGIIDRVKSDGDRAVLEMEAEILRVKKLLTNSKLAWMFENFAVLILT